MNSPSIGGRKKKRGRVRVAESARAGGRLFPRVGAAEEPLGRLPLLAGVERAEEAAFSGEEDGDRLAVPVEKAIAGEGGNALSRGDDPD